MATATKTPPAKKKKPAKQVEKGTLDYLELALENLNKAREHAQRDVRAQIDATVDRIRGTIRDVRAEITHRAAHGG
jgi:uncharacterized protein YicC (UPF0701 family)